MNIDDQGSPSAAAPTSDTQGGVQPGITPESVGGGEPHESEDAALDRILGSDAAAAAPAAAKDGMKPAEPAPADGAGAPNPKLDAAMKALRRDGVPESALKALTPEAILEWGSRRHAHQAEVDAYGAKLKDAEARAAKAASPKPESDPAGGAPSEATGNQQPEGEGTDDLQAKLAASIGEEAAAVVAKVLSDRTKAAAAAAQTAEAIATKARLESEALHAALEVLDGYGLGYAASRDMLARMSEIGTQQTGQFRSPIDLARAAAQALYGAPGARGVPGQPTAARSTPNQQKRLTPLEQENVVLDAILEGRSVAEARALAGIE